jgi:hypothetical protein
MRNAMETRRPLLQAFLFVVFGVYFVWFWAKGQTLAMKTWRIRIVDRTAARSPRARLASLPAELDLVPAAAGRAWPRLSSPAPEAGWSCSSAGSCLGLLARFHPERQFWHDAWAGTRLVITSSRCRAGLSRRHDDATLKPEAPVNPQKAALRPQPRLACAGYSLARPARRLGRNRLPPGSAAVHRDGAGRLLARAQLGRGGAAGRLVLLVMIVELLNTGSRPPSTASAPNGTTCPSAPRTWAAPPCCWRCCWPAASGSRALVQRFAAA